ncbi:hypothetical protein IMZ48_15570, partial [Candidatus Bathyarchaeota archaeon]|nr:hypothetical protein [Candidatus Bathyarchaeota archaeon]
MSPSTFHSLCPAFFFISLQADNFDAGILADTPNLPFNNALSPFERKYEDGHKISERERDISFPKAALEPLASLESDRVIGSTFTNKAAALDKDTITSHSDIEQHATPY